MGDGADGPLRSGLETVTSEDYEELALFLSTFPGEKRPAEFWRKRFLHWWENNPAFKPSWERGWALYSQGNIVGFFGDIPTKLRCFGGEEWAHNGTTWRVLPEQRGRSLALLFQWMKASGEEPLFTTTPTETVSEIVEKLGFKRVPRGEENCCFWVLRWEAVLKTKFAGKLPLEWICPAAGFLLDLLQKLKFSSAPVDPQYSVSELTFPCPGLDELWERYRDRFSNILLRSENVYRWYCDGRETKVLFGLFRQGHLEGTALFNIVEENGDARFEMLDAFGDLEDVRLWETLALNLRKNVPGFKVSLIRVPCFSPVIKQAFKKNGFYEREQKGRRQFFFLKGRDFVPSETYFTQLVGDIGL